MVYLDVTDISLDDVESSHYNLVLFACGYEERSIFFPGVFESSYDDVMVFGFAGSEGNEDYALNSNYYARTSRYKVSPTLLDYSDANKIFSYLVRAVSLVDFSKYKSFKILVDYSSMPRLWYSEILNFIKNYEFSIPVRCDFAYSIGEHSGIGQAKQLSDPIVLPGCAAVSTFSKETVGIFSLGFNEGGPICLHHKIEPDVAFSIIARPGALDDYTERTLQCNRFFLDNFSSSTIYPPLHSVAQCYSVLREIFFPYLGKAGIVMVPFGPKPHALASILAAMNYPEVSCLYSSMGGSGGAVKPTTELVISRVDKLDHYPYMD
ncbi:hypothetical protein [Pseudomonas sp. CF10PS3]